MPAAFDRLSPELCGIAAAAGVTAQALLVKTQGASVWIAGALVVAALTVRLLPGQAERPSVPWPAAALLAYPLVHSIPLPGSWHRELTAIPSEIANGLAVLGVAVPTTIGLNPAASLEGFLLPGGCLAALLLAARAASNARGFLAAASLLVIGGAVQALIGFGQFHQGLLTEGDDAWASGTFVHRGHFAGFTAASAWLAGGLAFATRRTSLPATLALAATAAVCLCAVLLSHSRLAIAAAVFLAAALPLVCGPKRAWSWTPAGVAAVVGLLLLPVAGSTVAERFVAVVEQGGDAGRLAVWRDTIAGLADAPALGAGLGSFPWVFRRADPYLARHSIDHAHSDYLEWVVELGMIPAIGLCLMLAWVVGRLFWGLSVMPDSDRRIGAGAALLGCLTLLLHGVGDSVLHATATATLAATLLGLAAGSVGLLRRGAPRATTAALAAALCAWALAVGGALLPLDLETQFRLARQDHLAGDHIAAEQGYRRSLAACPTAASAWLGLAELRRSDGDLQGALKLLRLARAVEPSTYRVEWPLAEAELAAGETQPALGRLGELLVDLPDLRPAALQMAWRFGVDLDLIETHLIVPQGEAIGEYLAFLVRTGNREMAVPAFRRLSIEPAIELPPVLRDFLERQLGGDFDYSSVPIPR